MRRSFADQAAATAAFEFDQEPTDRRGSAPAAAAHAAAAGLHRGDVDQQPFGALFVALPGGVDAFLIDADGSASPQQLALAGAMSRHGF